MRKSPAGRWLVAVALLAAAGCGAEPAAPTTGDAPPDLRSEPADVDAGIVLDVPAQTGGETVADAGAEDTSSPPEPAGWHVAGGKIRDPQGRERILHGINVSNDTKHAPYESWAGPEDYARLREWGFSVVRLLTSWAAVMPEEGVIDEAYLATYDERVDLAGEHGLAVIVDFHQDVYGEGFGGNGAPRWTCAEELYAAHEPRSPWYINYASPQVMECYDRFFSDPSLQDRYIEAMVAVLTRLEGREHVVGVDIMNEPSQGSADIDVFHHDILQPFYERVIAGLSSSLDAPAANGPAANGPAANGLLFFVEPTPIATSFNLFVDFEPFATKNVVYAPHYYLYAVHDGHLYDGDSGPIEGALLTLHATAGALGVPWLLGEWGGHTDSIGFDQYCRDVLGLLEGYQTGDTYWEYSPQDGGFSPLRADRTAKDHVVDVIARVYPKAVAGDLLSWRFDDQSRVFTMTFRSDPAVLAPTLLAVPAAQHYPGGLVVESSDPDGAWSYEWLPEQSEVRLSTDPQRSEHSITIRSAGEVLPAP